MPPKLPDPSNRDDLATLRARVRELEEEVARRQREAAAMAEAARLEAMASRAGIAQEHARLFEDDRPARPARVLVIDDEAGVREIRRELLGGEGYTVVVASDGPAGLALWETEPVDLVLSDVSMPAMSGWDVAEACHARFPDIPVGLITGWGDRLDPAQLTRHGIRFVVAKPFEAAEVLHRVGDALAARDQA